MNRPNFLAAILSAFFAVAVAFGIVATPSAGVATGAGCSGFSTVTSTLPALGACVIEAAGSDFVAALNDPASLVPAIINLCSQYGVVTGQAIVAYIESWFAASPAFPDSGIVGLSDVRADRLHRVLAAALGQQDGGGGQ